MSKFQGAVNNPRYTSRKISAWGSSNAETTQQALFYRELDLPRCVSTAEGKFWTKHTTFTELEGQLDPQIFLRIHRQAIVNLNHIREIGAYDKHSARLTLTGGHEAVVSRSYLKTLRQILQW
jgi:hypothetical protein